MFDMAREQAPSIIFMDDIDDLCCQSGMAVKG
jgi:ATP-dependent 26S proteasome regulatory subunit